MPDTRPNILFIFTDQQRADAIGALNPVIRTPVLDRLAAEGTLFTNAYTPAPVCVAARCSLIFGQYPHNTGCFDNAFPMPEVTPQRPTFMSALAQAGYQTHGIGKMHFTPDPYALRGFQHRERCEELANPREDDYCAWLHSQGFDYIYDTNGARSEMYYIPQVAQWPAWADSSSWVAEQAVHFIQHRPRKTPDAVPFLLWASFIDPHPPFAPPVPWNKLYRGPDMPLPKRPPDYENLHTYINRCQNRYKFRDAGIDDRLNQMIKAYYYATISFVDYNVGRILRALEATGQLENTLILWSSDHGEFLGDYHCFGKRSFLKSAANIPLVARYPPRFAAAQRIDAPVSLIDIFPTFLAAAGTPIPASVDGIDLADVARNPAQREMVFGSYIYGDASCLNTANYMALSSRWKYIYSASENRQFLFDRLIDAEETRNRAETPTAAIHTEMMRTALIHRLRQDGYTAPLDDDAHGWRVFPPPQFPQDPDAGLLFQDPPRSLPVIPGYT